MFEDQLQPWQQLRTKPLLDHPWCRLVEDHVRLPSGKEITWWRFHPTADFVAVLCINAQDELLVAYQYNHPPQCILDELPGGGIEPSDTSIEDAARRELREETGIDAKQIRLIGSFLPNNRRSASRCHVCVATDLEQRQATPEENEQIAFQWLALHTIDQAIGAGTLINGILLAAWSLYGAAQRAATPV